MRSLPSFRVRVAQSFGTLARVRRDVVESSRGMFGTAQMRIGS